MEEEKVVHIVQQGENLGELTKYYTGGTNYGEIAQNNGISDPNKIFVGQKIEFSVSGDSEYAKSNPDRVSNSTSTQADTTTQTETTSQENTTTQTETTTQENIATQTETTTQENTTTQTDATSQENTVNQTDATSQTDASTPTETSTQTAVPNQQNGAQPQASQTTGNRPRSYSNKWLCPSCPQANDFYVDKSHTDYYIGYLDSKESVTAINDAWKNNKSCVDALKNDIEALKQSIDSQDYKKQTDDIIAALNNSIASLDKNFNSLFNSVVNRLIEAAASDEWFSETAIQYATFISETILGKPAPAVQNNNAAPAAENSVSEATPTETTTSEPAETVAQNPQPAPAGRVSNSDAASQLGITQEQLDVVKATIRHEAGNNPNEMLVVASVIKNRMNSGVWGGTDAYSVTTAKGQFESYLKGHYQQYTGGNYYQGGTQEDVDAISEQINAILTGSAEPLTDCERFRSGNGEGRIQYNPGGNYYF